MSTRSTIGRFVRPATRTVSDRRRTAGAGRLLALTALVAISVVACGDGNEDDQQALADSADAADADVVGSDDGGGGDDVLIAACTLLSDEEAAEVLGSPIDGREEASGDDGSNSCRWKDQSGWSLTIDIGSPGTAPGNEFDPASVYGSSFEPVSSLEGASYVGMGTVAFASHDRVITVFVATGGGDIGRDAAEDLAPLVHQRIQEATDV